MFLLMIKMYIIYIGIERMKIYKFNSESNNYDVVNSNKGRSQNFVLLPCSVNVSARAIISLCRREKFVVREVHIVEKGAGVIICWTAAFFFGNAEIV